MNITNPIIPGFAPDPSVVHVDGVFYLANSSFHLFPGIPIYTSQNLRDWKLVGHAIHRPEQLSLYNASSVSVPLHTGGRMIATGGLFAPTIRHHRGTFYIVCTNATLVPSIKVENFLISTTDIWSGRWSNPIPISYPGIDPSLFFDDDDRAYVQGSFSLGLGNQPSCTIKQFEVDVETGKALTDSREIWAGHSRIDTEGPHIYNVDGWYYLLVAEGGTFEHHMLSVARSKSIWGPYQSFEGNPILTADGKPDEYAQNSGHGELFQDAKGQWWAAVLAVRNEATCQPLGRETFLTTVHWPGGSWPQIQHPKAQFEVPSPLTLLVDDRQRVSFHERIQKLDARLEDIYIRDPETSCYVPPKSSEPSSWTLFPSLEDLARPVGTSTFIGNRQRSFYTTATASIDLFSLKGAGHHGIMAGLAVYKDHLRHLLLRLDNNTKTVAMKGVNGETNQDSTTCEKTLAVNDTAQIIHFKIVSSPIEYRGLAAVTTGGQRGEWADLGSWETKDFAAREMVGPIFGIFAHSATEAGKKVGVVFPSFKLCT
ncbi:glycosyl hydrolase [Ilyonectria destructans]|nr:glycosyl hydrolase [Ilyonectria destructans]